MPPPRAARRSVTARRSTSRSRPTIRGSRCASWPSARPPRSASRPTSTCSPTARPTLLPAPTGDNGLGLGHSAPATQSLLDDLRSDKGMGWVPTSGWLSKVRIDASAPQLAFDLAIDATGAGAPSRVMAGLDLPGATVVPSDRTADVDPDHRRADAHDRRHRRDPPAGPPPPAAVDGLTASRGDTMNAHRRPGRLALVGGIAARAGRDRRRLGARARARPVTPSRTDRRDPGSALRPRRSLISVPAGVAVTFVLRNDDPIDHEFIVGDAAVHERHRTGTEPVHGVAPDRGDASRPAPSRTTTITFTRPGRTCSSATCPATRRTGWSARSWSSLAS